MTKATPLNFCLASFEAWWQAEMLKSFPKDYASERLLEWGSDSKDDARAGFIAAWKIRDRMESDAIGCDRVAQPALEASP